MSTTLPYSYDTFGKSNDNLDIQSKRPSDDRRFKLLVQAMGAVVMVVGFVYLFKSFNGNDVMLTSSTSTSTTPKTVSASGSSGGASASKPNIVFIHIDDMGYGSIGYHQYDIAGASPFMNSLIEDGMYMSNYYAQEECTPSRAALMTGRYPITTGMQYHLISTGGDWGLNTTEILLPEILRTYGGYATYGVGKWHLGHFSNEYLPTARGFDQFMGYMSGEVYPWSKEFGLSSTYYTDQLYMNATCYYPYKNKTEYTTNLYRENVEYLLEAHDFEEKPMFLYIPFQAVHNPFRDLLTHTTGMSASLAGEEFYAEFSSKIAGTSRLQYALSLHVLDKAVESIYNKIETIGQLNNTYFIIASDNGGCYGGGGRNGNLRGSKGSLFEGGVHVDAMIYSKLLPSYTKGQNYSNLFHVSDWLPTLAGLANVEYTPDESHALDGIDHSANILAWNKDGDADVHGLTSPRTEMVYNIYYNVDSASYTSANAPYAIRNNRYKLSRLHADNSLTTYYNFSTVLDDDTDLCESVCSQDEAVYGPLTHFLFDLWDDPNETTNLYDTTSDPEVVAAQTALVTKIGSLLPKVKENTYSDSTDSLAKTRWASNDYYLMPWYNEGDVKLCVPTTNFVPISA